MAGKTKKKNCRDQFYSGLIIGIPLGVLILLLVAAASVLLEAPAGRGRSTQLWTENNICKPGEPIDLTVQLIEMEDIDKVSLKAHLYVTMSFVAEDGRPYSVSTLDDLPGFSVDIPRENFEQISLYGDEDKTSLRWSGQVTIHQSDREHTEFVDNVDMNQLILSATPWKQDEDGVPTVYSAKNLYLIMDFRGDE